MQIKLNLKPQYCKDYSKEGLVRKITTGKSPSCSPAFGYGYTNFIGSDDGKVRVFSLQKTNAKFEQSNRKRKSDNPLSLAQKVRIKKKVQERKWEAYYYDIPVSLLKLLGKNVEQGTRTWKFVNK